MYVSDILGKTDTPQKKSANKIQLDNGLLFSIIGGASLGLMVANFRGLEYIPSILVGTICGGIIGKTFI